MQRTAGSGPYCPGDEIISVSAEQRFSQNLLKGKKVVQQVFFVRHGETDWNAFRRIQGQSDIPLNQTGRIQAGKAAEAFRDLPLEICFSSPFSRAYETAELILQGRKVPIVMDDMLKEISYGSDEGQDLGRIHEDSGLPLHAFFHAPESYIPPDGGETIPRLQYRCGQFLEMLKEMDSRIQGNVLVTTHGAWIQAMILLVDNRPVSEFWHGKRQGNCSVTVIRPEHSGWKLVAEAVSYI